MADEELVVEYTLKEILLDIDERLKGIDLKLDDKIGRVEFEELKARVNENRTRAEHLEVRLVRVVAAANAIIAATIFAANHYL